MQQVFYICNMKKIVFTLLFLFSVSGIYAQVTYKTHTVEKGENLTQIAKKYYTTADDIRRLNPGIMNELSANQQIKVPDRDGAKLHEVQPKERSEERRVGKECRTRVTTWHNNKNKVA